MGLRDADEMLEAAQAQSVIDERLIAIQQGKLTAIRDLTDRYGHGEGGGVPTWVTEIRTILDGTPTR